MKIGAIRACITLENDSLAHREWRFLSTSGIEGFREEPETQLARKAADAKGPDSYHWADG